MQIAHHCCTSKTWMYLQEGDHVTGEILNLTFSLQLSTSNCCGNNSYQNWKLTKAQNLFSYSALELPNADNSFSIIINQVYPKPSALGRVRPQWGNLPKLLWAQYLADLIWSCFFLQNMHAYSANHNHSWLRGGGQAPQLFPSCTSEKQEGTTFIASLLPPNHSQLKQHWLINRARRKLFLGYKQQQNLWSNGKQASSVQAWGDYGYKKPCGKPNSMSFLFPHTKGRNRPPSPFPLSRCLTLTRLLRLGCSAWSSLKQTQGLAKAGERGTELPS